MKSTGVTVHPHVPLFVVGPVPAAVAVAIAVATIVIIVVFTALIAVVIVSSTATVVVVIVSSTATIFVVIVVTHVADHVLQLCHALVNFVNCRVACG